ncbi:MAG: hypothetical protein LBH19_11235 [Dysgonamonadaceae bacterium]|nr:hypothetical protein [Dysgonamonadaceae bacterium]
MSILEITSLVLNLVLGGGFLQQFLTLRSFRRKSSAEADSSELSNTKELVEMYKLTAQYSQDQLVATSEQLKKTREDWLKLGDEIFELRKEVQQLRSENSSLKRELSSIKSLLNSQQNGNK